ncbi:hypothetical protein [Cochlodiniinecator piscidefendens]|uniref:hypothetical protein n=1 Tax=Cochlodiniinecator piscidefendens TaxID=2715756 RepID=UPI00140D0CCB|nr:hypothetical protein [Cochlodiniinecator piscidefendens]
MRTGPHYNWAGVAIQEVVGEQMLGIDLETLIQHDFTKNLDPYDFLAGIEEAEGFGYVRVSRMIGQSRPNIPNEPSGLRAIAQVSILGPGYIFCDDLL